MIYYSLSMLMLAEIRDILLISTPEHLPLFRAALGDGSMFGIRLSFAEQPRCQGLAQAFLIGEDFIGGDRVALILGDNIFYGGGLKGMLSAAALPPTRRDDFPPIASAIRERYGIVAFDEAGRAVDIIEKPSNPPSSWAVTGLYFYDNRVGRNRPLAPAFRAW